MGLDESKIATAVLLLISSGLVLGLSALPAALVIGACAALALARVGSHPVLPLPAILAGSYVLLNAASGLAIGGFDSIRSASVMEWVANEGRVFLYYWPFLFVIVHMRHRSKSMAQLLKGRLRLVTWFALAATLASSVLGESTFGSHHAAGVFSVTLAIYHFHSWLDSRLKADLLYLLMSLGSLLATNSRTSLAAGFASIALFFLLTRRMGGLVRIAALTAVVALVMPVLFSEQASRIGDAANGETFDALVRNYRSTVASGGIEMTRAWDASAYVGDEGNTNVAIRGYLWGRAVHEGLASPVIGSGFGRYNDVDRGFEGIEGVFYPAMNAGTASASNLTAHNSFLHVFAELGLLGLANLTALLVSLWRPLRRNCGDDLWAHVGLTSLICLVLMSITQHAFGAPIFGLSLFCMVAIGYQLSVAPAANREPAASTGPSGELVLNGTQITSPRSTARPPARKVVVT